MRPARIAHFQKKNIALARVVSKEAKLYFISGPRKGAPECPSAASACRQKGYLVPGDEILTNSTDDLCAQAAPDCWRCSGHQGGGVDAVLRPLPTKMRSADLGAAAAWQASIAKKGLGGDRGRPEEEKYGNTIAPDRVIQRQFFGDPPTAVAAAIIEHALDFDGRYGVHTSPRVWLPCANLCIRRPLPHQDEAFLPPPCRILLVRPRFMAGLFLGVAVGGYLRRRPRHRLRAHERTDRGH